MTPEEYREESIHIAIGRVFGMVEQIDGLLSDTVSACRDKMDEFYPITTPSEFYSAQRTSCDIESAANAFRPVMVAAMMAAHRKIWPVEDWD